MIEHARDHAVDNVLDRARPRVEGGARRQQQRPGQEEKLKIPDVDQAQRGFPGNQNELAPFLEHHVGRPLHGIPRIPMGDSRQRPQAARDDDHRVKGVGSADKRGVHAGQIVFLNTRSEDQPAGQFVVDDLPGVAAEDDVDLVGLGIQVVQEPLGVSAAAGAGDGHEDPHSAGRG